MPLRHFRYVNNTAFVEGPLFHTQFLDRYEHSNSTLHFAMRFGIHRVTLFNSIAHFASIETVYQCV